jgi:two-component system, OmpR family, sensor histidine kinase CiaH
MFQKTRLRLTFWYLLIIMAISIAFSIVIYIGLTREFDRALRLQRFRIEHPEFRVRIFQGQPLQLEELPYPTPADPQVIAEAKLRLLAGLVGINVIILFLSSVAGYFLAGRTLQPIQEMIDEQNRFITDASHELHTPLTSLRTMIEVNLRDKHLTSEKAQEVLVSNLEEVEKLQELSAGLIELTQYQKPNGNFHMGTVSLSEIIHHAVETVRPLAVKKDIALTQKSEEITMQGNEKSLAELCVTLLDNAIKYSPEKATVSIHAFQKDSKVEIVVKDTGIGIQKEDIPHIFDRFYRVDKSRTKQHIPGYGLGLSIAKRIVTLHKGTIQVTSAPGKGTTFTILIPKEG